MSPERGGEEFCATHGLREELTGENLVVDQSEGKPFLHNGFVATFSWRFLAFSLLSLFLSRSLSLSHTHLLSTSLSRQGVIIDQGLVVIKLLCRFT